MFLLTLLLIPMVIALIAYLSMGKAITYKEFLLQLGIQIVFGSICAGVVYWSNLTDYETWSGRIVGKTREQVHCRHSYECFCYESCSGSGSSRSCMRICQTCYHHSYDVDWWTKDSVGERFNVNTIDWQGLQEPSRWTSIRIGEPSASSHSYDNYIKKSDTLFRRQGATNYEGLPGYPGQVYDLYRINRTVTVDMSLPDAEDWDNRLDEINADLGRSKEVNAVLVLVKNKPRDYFQALEAAWLGGKKNDAILVIGVDNENKIQWADVMAFTDNKLFNVILRDAILEIGTLDKEKIFTAFGWSINTQYKRKSMSDLEYLKYGITPTTTQWVICMILGFLLSLGIAFWVFTEDVFSEELRRWR